MNENEEANGLIGRIESMAGNLKDKPIDNVQLDLLECVAHLLTNITFQVAMECAKTAPVEAVQDELAPGDKCEVNFVVEDLEDAELTDWWQLATVLEVRRNTHAPRTVAEIEYRTSAAIGVWFEQGKVRRPVEKK